MISNQLWVWAVDHRISAAIVLFVLMLVLNTGKRRSRFFLRAGVSMVVMCLCSWLLRTLSDEWIRNVYLQAMCYSVQIMVDEIEFAESKSSSESAGNTFQPTQPSAGNANDFMNIPDGVVEDLPFN